MSLVALGEKFAPTPLYMVGGAVRNTLLGIPPKDIDITSSMRAEDVIKLLEGSEFCVVPSSLRMGTLIIKDGRESYEYTCFRVDSYPLNSGVHKPSDVIFTDDIREDARRRDFTINAIYQDVLTQEIVDPLGGVQDIKRRVIRTTRSAREVFSEDGLRLMRLVRFYAELGFEIDGECEEVAKSLAHLIKDISIERVEEELSKIIVADKRGYGNVDGHYKGIVKMIDLGIMDYVIPELTACKGVKQNPKYHDDDVLSHILNVYKIADPSVRLAALLHDIGKPVDMALHGNVHMHHAIGSKMAKGILMRMRFANKVVEEVSTLVYMHMFDINCDAKVDTVKKFILEYSDFIEKFLLLRYADARSSLGGMESYDKIHKIYQEMIESNVPLSLDQLAIGGNDLIALGYKGAIIGKILSATLKECALSRVENTKEELVKYVRGEQWK